MQRLSFLWIASLSCFVLGSCKDVSLGRSGVDAGGGGGGRGGGGATAGAGGSTSSAAGSTATGGTASSTGGTTSSTGGTTTTTLASGLNSPFDLVVDATSVYFINGGTAANNYADGTLMKVPVGGGKTTTIVSGQRTPSGIAIAGTNLYWTTWGTFVSASTDYTLNTVMTVPIAGGTPVMLVSGQEGPSSVAVDATNVYWTNSTGTVMKRPLMPPGGGAPTTLASGLDFPGSIAVDATNVYWMSQGTSGRADGYARLMAVPIKGGTATTLASADRVASGGIAVDATSVYWAYSIYYSDNPAPGGTGTPDGGTAGCAGTVMRVPIGGGTPTTLASGQFCPSGQIAVDATAIYWVNGGLQANGYTDGAVMALPLAGGTPITVAAMQKTNGGLAIDATSVYWTVGGTADGDGMVLTAPKIAIGCDLTVASNAITALGITATGAPQTLNDTLPATLTDANWSLKATVCQQGGYDITPLAGKPICLVKQETTQLCQGIPANVWVVMNNGAVGCVYQTVALNPGVFSVLDPSCVKGTTQPDGGACDSCPQPVDGGGTGGTPGASCEPGATLIGASYDISKSRFAFGSTPVREDTTELTRWVGSHGVVAIWSCGHEEGSMNGGAPETNLPDWSSDSSALSDHVRAYLISMGVEPCQIARTQVQAGTDGYTISLVRGIDGIAVGESIAYAKFNVNDQTTSEGLYWPTIPAATVASARAFRDLLADPAALAAYKAKLPATAQGDGVVAIHHPECPSLISSYQPVATYDVSSMGAPLSFDVNGKRVSTDMSPVSP